MHWSCYNDFPLAVDDGTQGRLLPRRRGIVLTRPFSAKSNSNNENDDDDDDDNVQNEAPAAGMARAFQELDALKSLDDDDDDDNDDSSPAQKKTSKVPFTQSPPSSSRIEASTTVVDAMGSTPPPKASPEADFELYKDMYSESEKEDVELYSDMLTDMGGTPSSSKATNKRTIKVQDEDERVELLESLQRSPDDINVFMNQALQEALEEAKKKTPDELASMDPLDDEEMMEEIKQVFEKANDELLASLEDIRSEQAELAKASAERNAQARMDAGADNDERMQVAQASMEKMLKKVNKETLEVEQAVRDLKAAQEEVSADPLYQLRSGGIVKQGALVGMVLFGGRAFGEVLAVLSTGPANGGNIHTLPALLQGAIALVCAAYFFLA